MIAKKMKVDIWSDVTCMFCYTAKQKFENALLQFKDRDHVEVVWRSFELAPELKTDPTKRFPQFLAELRGVSLEQSKAMIDQAGASVKELGLTFNLHEAIPANTFNAHRLSHLAKHELKQNEAEERLFKAYFTEGKNIDDLSVLFQLAKEIGLDPNPVKMALESSKHSNDVKQDIDEAKKNGITSVPFFRFNSSLSISGAQDSTVFLETLEKSFAQWKTENLSANPESVNGQSCNIGEDCL